LEVCGKKKFFASVCAISVFGWSDRIADDRIRNRSNSCCKIPVIIAIIAASIRIKVLLNTSLLSYDYISLFGEKLVHPMIAFDRHLFTQSSSVAFVNSERREAPVRNAGERDN
jgi:hypothetical protein